MVFANSSSGDCVHLGKRHNSSTIPMKAPTKDRLRRFAKLKFALGEVQLLNFALDPFLIETRLCPRSLAPTLVVTPVRLGPSMPCRAVVSRRRVAQPIRSIHSLSSRLALRYPRGPAAAGSIDPLAPFRNPQSAFVCSNLPAPRSVLRASFPFQDLSFQRS